MQQYLSEPDIVETLGMASLRSLKDIMTAKDPSVHSLRVLAHLRKGSRYNEITKNVEYDNFYREVAIKEREAARLVELMRRAYDKMNIVCKQHNATARRDDFDGPLTFKNYHTNRNPIVELAAHFKLISEDNRHDPETEAYALKLLKSFYYHGSEAAASLINDGVIISQAGAEFRKHDPFKLLEDYLGISEYKRTSVEKVNFSRLNSLNIERGGDSNLLMLLLTIFLVHIKRI